MKTSQNFLSSPHKLAVLQQMGISVYQRQPASYALAILGGPMSALSHPLVLDLCIALEITPQQVQLVRRAEDVDAQRCWYLGGTGVSSSDTLRSASLDQLDGSQVKKQLWTDLQAWL